MIYCFSVHLVSLSQVMEEVLFETVCTMVREGSRKKKFKGSGCQGEITTKFETKFLNGVYGLEFFADVDTPLGSGTIHFLVRQRDIQIRNEMVSQIAQLASAAGRRKPMYN